MKQKMRTFSVLIITLFISHTSFSQKKKLTDDLDSLFLKSGEIKTGVIHKKYRILASREKRKRKHETIKLCDEKGKNCIEYHLKDVKKITMGWVKFYKRKYRKTGLPSPNQSTYYIIKYKNQVHVFATKYFEGDQYTFYDETVEAGSNPKGTIYKSYYLITDKDSDVIRAWFSNNPNAGSENKTTKVALSLFENTVSGCQKIEKALENKPWKKTKNKFEYMKMLFKMIDGCNLDLKN